MGSHITIYIGRKGHGKSLGAAVDTYYEHVRHLEQGVEWPIVSNVPLAVPWRKLSFPSIDEVGRIPWLQFQNLIMLWDEMHVWADSRRAMGWQNIMTTYFVTQIRKRNISLRGTTQTFGQVDVRIREMTDYLILCEKVWWQSQYWSRQKIFIPPFESHMSPKAIRMMPINETLTSLYDHSQVILPGAEEFETMYDLDETLPGEEVAAVLV